MSYPPERHVLRDLRLSLVRSPGRPDRVVLPIAPALRNAAGHVHLGALAVAVDLAAAGAAMRAVAPDWLATAELEIHARACPPEGVVLAEPILLRSGRTTAVYEVSVRGYASEEAASHEPGVPVAHSTMTFVRIARPAATSDLTHPAEPTETVRVDFAGPSSGLLRPFLEELDIRTVDAAAGHVSLPRSEFAANSFGSLQGGIVATLAQAACEAARASLGAADAVATDLSVHYLAQGTGPYETRCELLDASRARALHRVEVRDVPSGITMATASVLS